MADHEEPPLGSRLITPRRGFAHHGIYVGGGKVVHYGALARYFDRGPVEEVTLARFSHGHPVWVRSGESRFNAAEVIRRARSRIGENRYRLLSNNCEHFCEWCLHDRQRSYQVEEMFARPQQAMRALNVAMFALLSAVVG